MARIPAHSVAPRQAAFAALRGGVFLHPAPAGGPDRARARHRLLPASASRTHSGGPYAERRRRRRGSDAADPARPDDSVPVPAGAQVFPRAVGDRAVAFVSFGAGHHVAGQGPAAGRETALTSRQTASWWTTATGMLRRDPKTLYNGVTNRCHYPLCAGLAVSFLLERGQRANARACGEGRCRVQVLAASGSFRYR